MRTEVRVIFHGHHIAGGAEAVLGPAGCGPDVATVEDLRAINQVDVVVTLEASDPRLPVLCQILRQHGEEWFEDRRDIYTDEEIERATLIMVWTTNEHRVFGGPRVGTRYDMTNACPVCGAGARQTSAQMIDGEDLHRLEGVRAASTGYDDLLVDERLAEELLGAGITGLSFRGVYAVMPDKRQIKLPWRQLCARHTLPPMSPRSTGIERSDECPRCGRSGFVTKLDDPPRLVYRARDLERTEDVNVTWEWFQTWRFNGKVEEAIFAYPWMLITPKVWRVLRDAGVTAYNYLPIRVDESNE